MQIKWIGKYNGRNLPKSPVDGWAKMPRVTTKHVLTTIPILMVLLLCVFFKSRVLNARILFSRKWLAVGFIIGIVLFPLHELLHAAGFPPGKEKLMFYTSQGLGITCPSPMSRNRWIFTNLLPSSVLGFVPLLLFLVVSKDYSALLNILFAIAFLHIGGSYVDYINVIHSLRIPRNSIIQISGEEIYWKAENNADVS